MAKVKQVIVVTKGKTKSKVSKATNGKRGNQNRCPTCGRYR